MVTLKWTTVGVGRTSLSKVVEMAFCTARAPVKVSTLTEVRYRAWQPVGCRYHTGAWLGPHGRSPRPWSFLHPEPGDGAAFLLQESSGAPL